MNLKGLLKLTKPGIIFGNLIPLIGGFFLASGGNFDKQIFVAVLGGVLIIAGSCILNNLIDRDIDSLMERTKPRVEIINQFNFPFLIFLGIFLSFSGIAYLFFFSTIFATIASLIGVLSYVIFYTFAKRKTPYAVYVGSISGAIPPLIGYFTFEENLNLIAFLLFAILFIWQLPHSFAILIFRKNDYQNAKIPTAFEAFGFESLKKQMIFYIIIFLVLNIFLWLVAGTVIIHPISITVISLYWLYKGFSNSTENQEIWAKKMFKISILAIMFTSISISL